MSTWGPRWVDAAAIRPHHCALVPYLGNSAARGGFIDTGVDLNGPGGDRVYLSAVGLEEYRRLGLLDGILGEETARHAAAQAAYDRVLAAKDAEIAELRAELQDADRQLEAVHVLKSAGYTAARKPGRPPKMKETVS